MHILTKIAIFHMTFEVFVCLHIALNKRKQAPAKQTEKTQTNGNRGMRIVCKFKIEFNNRTCWKRIIVTRSNYNNSNSNKIVHKKLLPSFNIKFYFLVSR